MILQRNKYLSDVGADMKFFDANDNKYIHKYTQRKQGYNWRCHVSKLHILLLFPALVENMRLYKGCNCISRKWILDEIIFHHADNISDGYLTLKWRETYRRVALNFRLVFEKNTFFAPYKHTLERLKNRERTKGIHESPTKKKVGLCGKKMPQLKEGLHEVCFVSIVHFCVDWLYSQEDRTNRKRLGKEAQAQEKTEMKTDFMELMKDQVEVQNIYSTTSQPTQVLYMSSRLASLLFD
ncbi:hypothetical protein HID58_025306 [Brassica napus]|uniref:Uncharacterized protein n=2 Tax=Brassica TaxID=3705 RepID=A0ABQ8CMT9_BRANA|nr:hypothetical protein HID58_025306 [Brassica napus]